MSRWPRLSRVAAGVVAVELIVLFAPAAAWLYERWTMSVWHHAHGLIIPPIVAYFCYRTLSRFSGPPPAGSAWGFAWLVPALALHVLDASMHTQLASAIALMLALPGLALLFLGVPRTRAILFPLAFMAFGLPIPLTVTEPIHLALRQATTAGVELLLPWFGISFFSEGTTIHLANGALQVADACSGFSTLYAATALACLLAYTTPGLARRAATLAAAVPLALCANVLRVLTLVVLVAWRGEQVLETWIHPASGMMTFAITLPGLFWLSTPPRPATRIGAA